MNRVPLYSVSNPQIIKTCLLLTDCCDGFGSVLKRWATGQASNQQGRGQWGWSTVRRSQIVGPGEGCGEAYMESVNHFRHLYPEENLIFSASGRRYGPISSLPLGSLKGLSTKVKNLKTYLYQPMPDFPEIW